MAKVLITGGTGFLGKHLVKTLLKKGFEVSILSRTRKNSSDIETYCWDINKDEIEKEALINVDYIIHLAGANIGDKRWTNTQKKEIIHSRVKSAELLFESLKPNNQVKAFISASAIGFYGLETSEKIHDETELPAKDFLGQVCEKWERVAELFAEKGIRTIKIRTGLVLSNTGGAFSKIIKPIKLGLGSSLGTGKQYVPWIHIDDLCAIYIKAIEDTKMNGAYNAVAPEHITNNELSRKIAKHLNKTFWFFNTPSIFLKLIFGEMADILLKGSRISSDKIRSHSYSFLFPNIDHALQNLLK